MRPVYSNLEWAVLWARNFTQPPGMPGPDMTWLTVSRHTLDFQTHFILVNLGLLPIVGASWFALRFGPAAT
jgi:hypothetical protein